MNEEELKFHNEFKDWTKEEILSRAFEIMTKNIELTKEKDKLQNNWNELKKCIEKKLESNAQEKSRCKDRISDTLIICKSMGLKYVLKKMQELEGNNE